MQQTISKAIHAKKSYLRNQYLTFNKIDKNKVLEYFESIEKFILSSKKTEVYTKLGKEKGLFFKFIKLVNAEFVNEVETVKNLETIISDKELKQIKYFLYINNKNIDILAQKYESNGYIKECLTEQDCIDNLEGLLNQELQLRNIFNSLIIKLHKEIKKISPIYQSYWEAIGENKFKKILYYV